FGKKVFNVQSLTTSATLTQLSIFEKKLIYHDTSQRTDGNENQNDTVKPFTGAFFDGSRQTEYRADHGR
ncbi:MAG: hypothetical protein ABF320_00180, partial [Lentimonas sp.]